jgi:hypothetical protein
MAAEPPVIDRGEFQDLNLRYKSAFEAYKRALDKNIALEKNRRATPADWLEEARARTALQYARREILIALGVDVSFDDE